MKELIVKEETTLFDKGVSIGGIIIGFSLITVIAMHNGVLILAPIVLGIVVMCILLGYFFSKAF